MDWRMVSLPVEARRKMTSHKGKRRAWYKRQLVSLKLLKKCRKAAGECINCPNNEDEPRRAVKGKVMCQECLDYHSSYKRARYAKLRAAGLCVRCAKARCLPDRIYCLGCKVVKKKYRGNSKRAA